MSPRWRCSGVAATSTHQPVTSPSGPVMATATSPNDRSPTSNSSSGTRSADPGGWSRWAPRAADASPDNAARSPSGTVAAAPLPPPSSPQPTNPPRPNTSAATRGSRRAFTAGILSPVAAALRGKGTHAATFPQRPARREGQQSGGRGAVQAQALGHLGREVVGLGVGREAPPPHVGGVSAQRAGGRLAQLGVAADELGTDVLLDAEHVVVDEHLAVAVPSGADADGGNVHCLGDQASHLVW